MFLATNQNTTTGNFNDEQGNHKAFILGALFTICTFIAIGIASVTRAEAGGSISIAGKVSTLGLGVELKYPFHDKFNGRLVYNEYDLAYSETDAGNRNVGDLKLNTFGLIGDWHPTGGSFRFSLGMLSNKNKLSARTEGSDIEYNNQQYMGQANILLNFKSLAPYFGLGWSSQKSHGLSVDFEVGALFQDTPLLSSSGTVTSGNNTCRFTVDAGGVATVTGGTVCASGVNQADFKTDIEAEHDELQDALNSFKIYPVLSLGIRYRF